MTSIEFWHSTPRKLAALAQVHADLNDPEKHKKDKCKQNMTVDGVPVSAGKHSPGGVGIPDTFVDQL